MYGRGAADMKAGVEAMMCAMEQLKNEELDCKVQLQIVTDEEIGGSIGPLILRNKASLGTMQSFK